MTYDPLTRLGNIQWGWPLPSDPASAFGVDWPAADLAVNVANRTVLPSATTSQDFDCSDIPNNAAAIIRVSILWFQVSGPGAVNLYYDVTVLAYRDSAGDLQCDINAWAGPAVSIGPGCFQVDAITVPDANTVRMQLLNLNVQNAIVFWRWVISTARAGSPVPPP